MQQKEQVAQPIRERPRYSLNPALRLRNQLRDTRRGFVQRLRVERLPALKIRVDAASVLLPRVNVLDAG